VLLEFTFWSEFAANVIAATQVAFSVEDDEMMVLRGEIWRPQEKI